MKLIATIPSGRHYRPLQSNSEGRWLWEDSLTPALRIQASTPNPWEQTWKIVPSIQNQKGDGSTWPYRLVLKCFPPDGEGIPATLEREQVKSLFAWSDHQPLAFYAFPSNPKIWMFYSFYATKT